MRSGLWLIGLREQIINETYNIRSLSSSADCSFDLVSLCPSDLAVSSSSSSSLSMPLNVNSLAWMGHKKLIGFYFNWQQMLPIDHLLLVFGQKSIFSTVDITYCCLLSTFIIIRYMVKFKNNRNTFRFNIYCSFKAMKKHRLRLPIPRG